MKKQHIFKMLATTILLVLTAAVFGNNIRVTINSYDAVTKKLNVTLAWDNSWHDGTGTFRDAAWLFVKYKDATMSEWGTAPLSNPTAAQIQATGNGIRFEILPKNLQTGGYRGWIVRRSKIATLAANDTTMTGVYNVSMTFDIPFLFSGTPVSPEFKVFGLEMVDIPKVGFYAGSTPSTDAGEEYTLHFNNAPKLISNETAALSLSYVYRALGNNTVTTGNVAVPTTFPKGVDEYYMMKYELSNEGFCTFLNCLTRAQQNGIIGTTAFANATTGGLNGLLDILRAEFTSVSAPAVFYSNLNNDSNGDGTNDGQWRPVIARSTAQLIPYLDWAGLRPMTELEYTKACRGPIMPASDDYAWGTSATTVSTPPDIDLGGANEGYSATFEGPRTYNQIVRCGAFAKATGATRQNSGGSYYGVQDLSNNAEDFFVTINGGIDTNPSTYQATNGDGTIESNGTTLQWPNANFYIARNGVVRKRYIIGTNVNPLGIRGVIK